MVKRPAVEAQRIAVDTNFILDCYDKEEVALGAWETCMERKQIPTWIIPPTVGQELLSLSRAAKTKAEMDRITNAARFSVTDLCFRPIPLAAVQHGIADTISVALRKREIIPEDERNDSLILAESSLLACSVLITKDKHLVGADKDAVECLLEEFHCTPTLILHPRVALRVWR